MTVEIDPWHTDRGSSHSGSIEDAALTGCTFCGESDALFNAGNQREKQRLSCP